METAKMANTLNIFPHPVENPNEGRGVAAVETFNFWGVELGISNSDLEIAHGEDLEDLIIFDERASEKVEDLEKVLREIGLNE
jgi:hypothetical protein